MLKKQEIFGKWAKVLQEILPRDKYPPYYCSVNLGLTDVAELAKVRAFPNSCEFGCTSFHPFSLPEFPLVINN